MRMARIQEGEQMMSAHAEPRRVPLLLTPLWALWKIITWTVNLVGIVLGLILGSLLMMIGLLLTGSIIGAVIGIPIFLIGLLLVARAIL
jgi:hypothetical protein